MRSLGGEEWSAWLREHGLVGLDGIDTRSLVLRLRDSGAMRAATVSDESTLSVDDALARVREQPSMEGQALVAQVSTREPYALPRRGALTSPSSTTARSARSCAGSRRRGRR